jgi:hypothetical protein
MGVLGSSIYPITTAIPKEPKLTVALQFHGVAAQVPEPIYTVQAQEAVK